jgi:hypothetical protein
MKGKYGYSPASSLEITKVTFLGLSSKPKGHSEDNAKMTSSGLSYSSNGDVVLTINKKLNKDFTITLE